MHCPVGQSLVSVFGIAAFSIDGDPSPKIGELSMVARNGDS
jgi:hypothetical protein